MMVGKTREALQCRRLHGRRGLKSVQPDSGHGVCMSPPSRAAWIEIIMIVGKFSINESPPSRAAWIEMLQKAL